MSESSLQDDLKEAMVTMMCSWRQGKHRWVWNGQESKSARYCTECNRLHPDEKGYFWTESSMLGLKITYFALMNASMWESPQILTEFLTEGDSQATLWVNPFTYHILFDTSGQQRATLEAAPADLQDFLN